MHEQPAVTRFHELVLEALDEAGLVRTIGYESAVEENLLKGDAVSYLGVGLEGGAVYKLQIFTTLEQGWTTARVTLVHHESVRDGGQFPRTHFGIFVPHKKAREVAASVKEWLVKLQKSAT